MDKYLLSLLVLLAPYSTDGDCQYEGTTPDLSRLIVGRCIEYTTTIQPQLFCDRDINCTSVSEEFVESFRYQKTCEVAYSRFERILNSTVHPLPQDKSLFWEDVYDAVGLYTNLGRRMVSIADTLYGYLGDKLRFCATTERPGIIFNKPCAGFLDTDGCPQNAEYSWWVAASKQFASSSNGKVHIMFNSSIEIPYKNNSYFSNWELPFLQPGNVTSAEILMVHFPGQSVRSTCSHSSIDLLKSILKKKGIPASCVDAPRNIQLVLCSDYPDEGECQKYADGSPSRSSSLPSVLILSLSCVLFVVYFCY